MTLQIILIEEALSIILEQGAQTRIEKVDLLESLGSVLAQDLTTDIDLPPFNSSAMDGFACRKDDLKDASELKPVSLDIVGHIGAGKTFDQTLKSGQTVRIMTGCELPKGADCVEMIENVSWKNTGSVGDRALFARPIKKTNVNPRGQEAYANSVVMSAGERIDPAAIGLLASSGHTKIPVYARPLVGILSTGSELVSPDELPTHGKIRDSNSYSLAAAAHAAGAQIKFFSHVRDDEQALSRSISEACQSCDIVVSSGGVSVGDFDLIPRITTQLGEVFFTRVNMKPGKSQVFARIHNASFFGLAGNPSAASIGFERLVRPLIRSMRGLNALNRPVSCARLTKDLSKRGERRAFLRGILSLDNNLLLQVEPLSNQSSSLIGTLHQSNCLIMLPEGRIEKHAGESVACLRLDIEEGSILPHIKQ